MGDFSRADALAFLTSWPAKLAHVSTARNDGSTVTVPVWYRIDTGAEQLLIWTGHERRWVKRVVASGHLSFSVAEDGFPLRGVMGGGPAVVLGDGEIDVDAERARIIEQSVRATPVVSGRGLADYWFWVYRLMISCGAAPYETTQYEGLQKWLPRSA